MIAIKKILVPVDFSEPSKKAASYGLTLAGQFNAGLILAHIVPESSALMYAVPTQLLDIEGERYARAAQQIHELVPAAYAPKSALQRIVRVGSIERELLKIVKDEEVNIVVMGTRGRRYLGHWFMGSVTEHMLRNVPVPVLTVSAIETEPHAIGLVALSRVLYATDLSESSSIGLKYAIELARGSSAQLAVMHVLDDEDRMLWGPALIAYLDRSELLAELRQKLDDLIEHEDSSGVQIEALVVEGKPFRKILEIAESRNVDIIVLNLQSKSIVDRALLGSTAERVVRLAHTPVLSVPVAGRTP